MSLQDLKKFMVMRNVKQPEFKRLEKGDFIF